ncbi:MAG TPA: hypothetical protein ACFYD0_03820 [Candidatus Wunengus sp. YC65]|uniref:hypothetical protein n=1 Tax=Candidatus Wunengus sp. YC65 TaxID=3367701 RepID=UPI004029293E
MIVLVATLLFFYVSRVSIIQLAPYNYVYPKFPLTLLDMRSAVFTLLCIATGLILGCFVGHQLGGMQRYSGPFTILPFEEKIKDLKSFYYLIIYIFIASRILLLVLAITTGVGIPIGSQFFSHGLLRAVRVANLFSFMGSVPIAWLILKKPNGIEKKITIFAITLFLLTQMATFSKVGMISVIISTFFVYYITGKKIPPRLLRLLGLAMIVGFILFTVMAALRNQLAEVFRGDRAILGYETLLSFDFSKTILGVLYRVGSSFDVLSAVIKSEAMFLPYLNLTDEFLNVVNAYIPGGVFATNAPQFAQLIPSILYEIDYEYLLMTMAGNNITLPGFLYLYFGVIGSAMVSFFVMLLIAFSYRHSKSILIKTTCLSMIVLEITNGSGLMSMIIIIPQVLATLYVFSLLYKYIIAPLGSAKIIKLRVPLAD